MPYCAAFFCAEKCRKMKLVNFEKRREKNGIAGKSGALRPIGNKKPAGNENLTCF
jgi:hypothetical protein